MNISFSYIILFIKLNIKSELLIVDYKINAITVLIQLKSYNELLNFTNILNYFIYSIYILYKKSIQKININTRKLVIKYSTTLLRNIIFEITA